MSHIAQPQRCDRARPVGKRKNISAYKVGIGWNIQVVEQAATWPPGREPGWRTRAQRVYSMPIPNIEEASPKAVRINQTRFPGRREATAAPKRANAIAWMV